MVTKRFVGVTYIENQSKSKTHYAINSIVFAFLSFSSVQNELTSITHPHQAINNNQRMALRKI